jgi:hypothetical protein
VIAGAPGTVGGALVVVAAVLAAAWAFVGASQWWPLMSGDPRVMVRLPGRKSVKECSQVSPGQ